MSSTQQTSSMAKPSEPNRNPKYDPKKVHITETPLTRSNWYKHVNWLNVVLIVGVPVLGLIQAIWVPLHLKTAVWTIAYYFATGLGITAGYHRLWAHTSYSATLPLRIFLAAVGGGAVEGSVRWWARDHRAHHRYTDTEKDPYSVRKGLLYSHFGWMLMKQNPKRIGRTDISDLNEDPVVVWQHKHYLKVVIFMGLIFPTLVCGLGWGDYWGGFVYAGILRIFFVQQATFCVNSLAHWLGDQPFDDRNSPRDHIITALVTLGEGYHNFHHEFPSDYRNAIEWHQYDPTKWSIWCWKQLGLAYDLKQFKSNEIEKGRVQQLQKKLDQKRARLDWGVPLDQLPVMEWDDYVEQTEQGRGLIAVAGVVHDITDFIQDHPGGKAMIKSGIGKDATAPAVEKRFDEITASTNGLLPRAKFGECIGMNKESKEFAGELYDALARRRNITTDSINKAQLKEFWDQIADQSFDTRLQTFFDMVDKDADGRITEEEVREIIGLSASANRLSTIQKQSDEYAAMIMEELDPNNLGYIMIENLEMLLLQAPNQSVQRGGESRNLSQMLSQKLKHTREPNPIVRWYKSFMYFLLDNWQRVWVLLLWIGIMAGLFTWKYIQYKEKAAFLVMGHCVCFAKGAAETLKLNMAIILLPVCRNTITWLRNKTRMGVAVPFDDNLNFHKVIAVAIACGVGIHGLAHLTCDFPRLLNASEEEYEPMKYYFGDQPESYWWFVKGVEGVTGIIMVVLMAIAFTLATPWFRRGRISFPRPFNKLTGFNAFWYSHHLFVIVYTLLIVHGEKLYITKTWYKRTTWMYLTVPLVLYAGERLLRAFRSSIKAVKILKVAVYPGNVLALHMSKPQGYKYKSGQYMFVNCAAVSPFEWHPFSITSAPGDDYLSVHIRTLGDWTRQLKTVFSEVCQPPPNGKSGLLRADYLQGENNPDFPKVLIDGPYGAPAQDYKKYEVVLLVGLGIGATPMISIVKDIVNNMKAMDEEENSLENGHGMSNAAQNVSPNIAQKRGKSGLASGRTDFNTRRAYFYWVTREQGSFDWFKGIMNEAAEMDHKGVIEMHNYCTSVYEEGDARSALITMLQSLHHAKSGVDIVSGTRVKSHFAKPNWRNVYKRIALNHPEAKVGVFYCGAPALTKELKQHALDFSHKTSTKFDFHKENF